MTTLETLISQHQALSYLIIFLGIAFIEADFFFLTGAIFADQKHLNWGALIVLGFIAVILGDVAWYCLGKYLRGTKIGPWLRGRFKNYGGWLNGGFMSNYKKIAFFSKFLYYVNRLVPFLAGWEGMPIRRFLDVHVGTGALWLTVMTTIGVSLGAIINLVGPRFVLERVWILFAFLAIAFIAGDHLLKKIFIKRVKGGN